MKSPTTSGRRFYFDHNACTPVDLRVLDRFREVEVSTPGNPGSLHGPGRRARGMVERARDRIARVLRVAADSVFFVSGGTEANNLVILGSGDTSLPVLAGPVEHPSVLQSADRRGLVSWPIDSTGHVIVSAPDQPVGLVAMVHGQNEIGALQPVHSACDVARQLAVPVHVDASQTLGRCPIDETVAAATSITFSTHKAGGLRGMSVLIDKNAATRPLFFGGSQQGSRRPGTESVALAAATALALELAVSEQPERAQKMAAARDAFLAQLQLPCVHSVSPVDCLPNTVMLHFEGVDGRELLPALDMAGVEASQGSACSSGSPSPPLILSAMGLHARAARACVRFSFSHHTSIYRRVFSRWG